LHRSEALSESEEQGSFVEQTTIRTEKKSQLGEGKL